MKIAVDSLSDPFRELDRLAGKEDDIVLADIEWMPSMNGFQFAKAARKTDPEIRIAVLTECVIEKVEAEPLLASLGVDTFLAKPVAASAFPELVGERRR